MMMQDTCIKSPDIPEGISDVNIMMWVNPLIRGCSFDNGERRKRRDGAFVVVAGGEREDEMD